MPFSWDSFWGALAGGMVAGCVASYVAFVFYRIATKNDAAMKRVEDFISEENSKKRKFARITIANNRDQLAKLACANHPDNELYTERQNIIEVLNKNDFIMNLVRFEHLSANIIRELIWQYIKDDHIVFDDFINEYSKYTDQKRPLFRSVRFYIKNWP